MIRKPKFCSIEVSYECILRCKMCYMWKNQRMPDELNIDEWKRAICSLKKFTGPNCSINITGGEPLLKKQVIDLVKFINQEGFLDVSMTTNGFLIDKEMARSLSDAGLRMISLSLDSSNQQIHDNIRGVPGAGKKVMDAIEYFSLHRGSLEKIGIQTIIMEPNIDTIIDLAKWADKSKISVYFMAVVKPLCLLLPDTWHIDSEFAYLWPKEEKKINNLLDALIKFKKDGIDIGNSIAQLEAFKCYFADPNEFVKKKRNCRMGDGMLKIGPQGEVALCAEKGSIGNVRKNEIEDIWWSEPANRVREEIDSCRMNCPQLINCYFEE